MSPILACVLIGIESGQRILKPQRADDDFGYWGLSCRNVAVLICDYFPEADLNVAATRRTLRVFRTNRR